MATSESASATDWLAGASVYSGRPEPTWPVDDASGEHIARLADALRQAPAQTEGDAVGPRLGYRGCWLRAPDGREWRASGGAVIHDEAVLADPGRAVERTILATAPPGLLPDWPPP
jgi:hypothetical protein